MRATLALPLLGLIAEGVGAFVLQLSRSRACYTTGTSSARLRMTEDTGAEDVPVDDSFDDDRDPNEVVPIIYKRLDETYDTQDYEGAFTLTEDTSKYDTNPENAAGERMLRVLMLGGSSSEAKILASLSEMEDTICGTYTSWDDSMGELHGSIPTIPFNNLYPCEDPADAAQQASLAQFICADVVVAGGSYSVPAKADFVAQLAKELEGTGILFVPPSGAGAMLAGDFSMLKGAVPSTKGEAVPA
ncbi:hypothetical protein JKP88DRAFT_347650 [Tribonema minus]|uniref:Uncharacterized protein n=1 Tax=Tribonema minus TaxID=303371 RepID=A0A835ZIR2_9STRA|nr:hypothetical protein JKP88DRAFT_347650 [Tribonema minus]